MVRARMTLFLGALSPFTSRAASDYTVNLLHPLQVATAHLDSGEYTLQLRNGDATFKRGKSSVAVPVAIQKDSGRVEFTTIETVGSDLRIIHLGGTNLKLVFPIFDYDGAQPAAATGMQRTARRKTAK